MFKRICPIISYLAFTFLLAASPCDRFKYVKKYVNVPQKSWLTFSNNQVKLAMKKLEHGLSKSGTDSKWKTHLHWPLLIKNLDTSVANENDLYKIRQALYSDTAGIEDKIFDPLRESLEDYRNAVFTLSHENLRESFYKKIELAKKQCRNLLTNPSFENSTAFGETLGWFSRTRQIPQTIAQVRKQVSLPNSTLLISDQFLRRLMEDQLQPVTEKQAIENSLNPPVGLIFHQQKRVNATGSSETSGQVSLRFVPNSQKAQLQLVFDGQFKAVSKSQQAKKERNGLLGRKKKEKAKSKAPLTTHSETSGPVKATKNIFLTKDGISFGEASAEADLEIEIVEITGGNKLSRRIAQKIADRESVTTYVDEHTHREVEETLANYFSEEIESAFGSSNTSQLDSFTEELEGFCEVGKPFERADAFPKFHGAATTRNTLEFQFMSDAKDQIGAVLPCPASIVTADLKSCFHQSFANNTFEKMYGGRILDDVFFMGLAQVFQAELPIKLMVHTRATRWKLKMAKRNPIAITFNNGDSMDFIMNLDGLVLQEPKKESKEWTGKVQVRSQYRLGTDDYGSYRLEKLSEVSIEGEMELEFRDFLKSKVDAMMAPILGNGGILIPDGGILGALKGIENKGIKSKDGWLVIGLDVPTNVLTEISEIQ